MSEYGYDAEPDTGGDTTSPEAGDTPVAAAASGVPSVAPEAGQPESAANMGDMDAPIASSAFTPQSAPGSLKGFYRVKPDDTSLDVIASKLGLSSSYHELFQPNMAQLEEAAKAAGYPGGSDQGTILIPGTWLEVPLSALAYYKETAAAPS